MMMIRGAMSWPDIDLWHGGGREETSARNLLLPCRDTSGFRKAGDKLQRADPCAENVTG